MKNLVTNPQEIERLAEELEDENWEFRVWIKEQYDFDDPKLNGMVWRLAGGLMEEIDCTACGNCCRKTTTPVTEEDLEQLSFALSMDISTFQATYLERDEESGGWELPAPCPFLEGNLCRVYYSRPENCRQYPHLHNDFRAASISRFNNTFICPIVFNLFELMKEELNWRPRSRRRRRRR